MPALRLDDFFGLNPAMTNFARLYEAKQALMVHATATNYRERSHFDGQDVLESGMLAPGHTESGWLNRAVAALPKGERAAPAGALAVGYTAPLVVRGPAPISGWAPVGADAADRRPRRPADEPLCARPIPHSPGRCRRASTPTGWPTGRAWMRSSRAATSRSR